MLKTVKPWMLVVVGILFNIASALITHYFIGLNNQQLNELEMKAGQHDTLIDSQWRNRTEIQRQREFLLLLLTQSEGEQLPVVRSIIRQQLKQTVEQQKIGSEWLSDTTPIGIQAIEEISWLAASNIIDTINDTYLEKLDILQQVQPLQDRNALLLSFAIFLQLLGLILVLAKDIAD